MVSWALFCFPLGGLWLPLWVWLGAGVVPLKNFALQQLCSVVFCVGRGKHRKKRPRGTILRACPSPTYLCCSLLLFGVVPCMLLCSKFLHPIRQPATKNQLLRNPFLSLWLGGVSLQTPAPNHEKMSATKAPQGGWSVILAVPALGNSAIFTNVTLSLHICKYRA